MNNYVVSFNKVKLEGLDIELSTNKIFEIFEELIEENCKITYEDEFDYGFTLLFKQLEKNKEEYVNSIKNIEESTKEDLEKHLDAENSKSLNDLL